MAVHEASSSSTFSTITGVGTESTIVSRTSKCTIERQGEPMAVPEVVVGRRASHHVCTSARVNEGSVMKPRDKSRTSSRRVTCALRTPERTFAKAS